MEKPVGKIQKNIPEKKMVDKINSEKSFYLPTGEKIEIGLLYSAWQNKRFKKLMEGQK